MKQVDVERIIKKALEAFRREFGINAYEVDGEFYGLDKEWDGRIALDFHGRDFRKIFVVEVKTRVTREALGPIQYIFKNTREDTPVLIARYVNPKIAEKLKDAGVQFMDTHGNAYINDFPLFIYVKGNKGADRNEKIQAAPKIFQAAGLKVLFALLTKPGLENKPYREIATKADVALGTVNGVFKNLQATGFLLDKGKLGREIIQRKKLLERWIIMYPEILRPTIVVGRYTAVDKYWWRDAILPEKCYWGGETAAAKMTQHLKPAAVTIYTHTRLEKILFDNRLKKDKNGEIEILTAFWGEAGEWMLFENKLVHPLLVYADLVATADARNHETANMIFENELYKYIG